MKKILKKSSTIFMLPRNTEVSSNSKTELGAINGFYKEQNQISAGQEWGQVAQPQVVNPKACAHEQH